jgi:predicted lipid-binding transport protein (Tim44 family)
MRRTLALNTIALMMLGTFVLMDRVSTMPGPHHLPVPISRRNLPSLSIVQTSNRPASASSLYSMPERRKRHSLLGMLTGGLVASLLFGGAWNGRVGFLDVVALSAFAYAAFRVLQARAAAPPSNDLVSSRSARLVGSSEGIAGSAPGSADRTRGIEAIRRVDPSFDARAFGEMVVGTFAKFQAAWISRDLAPAAEVLGATLAVALQLDLERMRAAGVVNHLESAQLQVARVTEAWLEGAESYLTVELAGTLIDYTTDERGTVVEGDRATPVGFRELWTFARSTRGGHWKLSAIREHVSGAGTRPRGAWDAQRRLLR